MHPPLPRSVLVVGSLAIAAHLFAVGVGALRARSGPWPIMDQTVMISRIPPPQFAESCYALGVPWTNRMLSLGRYLWLLHMTDDYHFRSNEPGSPEVRMEVRLKDEKGQEIARLTYPDPSANRWVRHRQALVANWLMGDEPAMPPPTETVAAPQQAARQVQIWEADDPQGRRMHLRRVPEHLIPRDRPVSRPPDSMMIFVRSYARQLCRKHEAASAEIIRHHRDPIGAVVLYMELPSENFEPVRSNFGELPR